MIDTVLCKQVRFGVEFPLCEAVDGGAVSHLAASDTGFVPNTLFHSALYTRPWDTCIASSITHAGI